LQPAHFPVGVETAVLQLLQVYIIN